MPKNILVTPLASFHKLAAEARPTIVVTFYEELKDSKSIVLGRADILDGVVMNKPEAIKLIDDLVLCYIDDVLYHHIYQLNNSDPEFDFDVFIHSLSKHKIQ